MSALGELVLIGLLVAMTEVVEVLEGTRRWALVCASNEEILPLLGDGAVGHVITDPPYSKRVHAKQWVGSALTKGRARFSGPGLHTALDFEALGDDLRLLVSTHAARCSRRWVLAFSDIEGCHCWREDLEASGLDYVRTGLWIKPDAAPQFTGDRPGSGAEAITIAHLRGRKRWNGGGTKAVFTHCINDYGRNERHHPTPKPVSLMLELVELFTDPDEVVLDPFAGSGTTGVACLRLGRRFIGVEKSPEYAAVARERLEAESQGLSLRAARAGQLPLLGAL